MTLHTMEPMWPYKLLTLFLYSDHDFITREGNLFLLANSKLCYECRFPSSKLRFYMRKLETLGLIYDLTLTHNATTFRITPPKIVTPADVVNVLPALITFIATKKEEHKEEVINFLDKIQIT